MKIYVIGNMGSGKSFLSKKLSESLAMSHLDLDTIFWTDGFEMARDRFDIKKDLYTFFDDNSSWVIEGVYRSLQGSIMQQADTLIYVNVPWSECEENLKSKGVVNEERLNYAKSYYQEERIYLGNRIYCQGSHNELFNKFKGRKIRFNSQDEINEFLKDPSIKLKA